MKKNFEKFFFKKNLLKKNAKKKNVWVCRKVKFSFLIFFCSRVTFHWIRKKSDTKISEILQKLTKKNVP